MNETPENQEKLTITTPDEGHDGANSDYNDKGDIGGRKKSKVGVLIEWVIEKLLLVAALCSVFFVFFILLFLFSKGYNIFDEVSVWDFITGEKWDPVGQNKESKPHYGAKPLIIGSLLVTLGAMVIAIPLGIGAAIYISELAPPKIRDFLKTGVELLAGIPSVVYGLFGLLVLTTWIQVEFDKPTGETWLAGSILLGIMALPTIISVAEDSISSVRKELKEGSLALGATKWQTLREVIIPSSISGITAAVILGMGRAVGETMAVMMVTGNAALIPNPITNVYSPVKTLTGALGIEMGEAAVGSGHQYGLFALAVILFVIVLAINTSALVIMKRIKEKHEGSTNKKKRKDIEDFPKSLRPAVNLYNTVRDLYKTYQDDIFKSIMVLICFWLFISWFGFFYGMIIVVVFIGFFKLTSRLDPKNFEKIAFGGVTACMLGVLFLLGTLLYYIIYEGTPALSWEFLTESPRSGGREGGIYPAIVGTLYLTIGAIAIAMPLGIGAGIYISEYARETKLLKIIRTGIDNLNGTPSIVFGLFGYAFLVLYMGLGVSMLAGQITLALMVLPTIIRTTEEALKSVPQSLREGSLALGATKWETTRRVVLPPAMPGIITGGILSIGRAIGETAPILFTAVVFSQRRLPNSVDDPVMALPYYILEMSMNIPGGQENAAGAALVLLIMVMSFYLVAAIIRKRFENALKGYR